MSGVELPPEVAAALLSPPVEAQPKEADVPAAEPSAELAREREVGQDHEDEDYFRDRRTHGWSHTGW